MTGTAESELGYVESPNLDRLAAEGVLFTDAYCNSLACAPSRSSMHTGKYPHRNGMYGFRKAHQAADCSSRIIPQAESLEITHTTGIPSRSMVSSSMG